MPAPRVPTRRTRTAAVLASSAVLAVGVAVGGPAAAAGESLAAVRVTPGNVAVTGDGVADVSVAVDMTLGARAVPCSDDPARLAGAPVARLARTSGASGLAADDLVDVALSAAPGGDPAATSGTWTGTWKAASTRNGTWTVVGVRACTEGSGQVPWRVDPRVQGIVATVAVTGSGGPRLTLVPAPVVWGARSTQARGTVTDASGRPVAGRPVVFGSGASCGQAKDGLLVRATGPTGVALANLDPRKDMCAYLATPTAVPLRIDADHALQVRRTALPRYWFKAVSALPLVAAVRVRTPLTVAGAVTPAAPLVGAGTRHTVLLQQRNGRAWRTIGTATVRSNGRYAVAGRPTARGLLTFRVVATSNRVMLATLSRPMLAVVY